MVVAYIGTRVWTTCTRLLHSSGMAEYRTHILFIASQHFHSRATHFSYNISLCCRCCLYIHCIYFKFLGSCQVAVSSWYKPLITTSYQLIMLFTVSEDTCCLRSPGVTGHRKSMSYCHMHLLFYSCFSGLPELASYATEVATGHTQFEI